MFSHGHEKSKVQCKSHIQKKHGLYTSTISGLVNKTNVNEFLEDNTMRDLPDFPSEHLEKLFFDCISDDLSF